jgi:SAM-dependent methyltransferase
MVGVRRGCGMTGSTSTFDPVMYKETLRQQWDNVAEGWHKWIPIVRRWAGPATDLMLDLARIGPGSRVLDVAAGDGDQSLTAAQRVGPSGYLLATDIAPNLVAIAARVFRGAGLKNTEARVMDAEELGVEDASFDAVISRFGLFFLPDLARALLEIRRALKPGGRIAAIVFSTPDKNPFLSVPISVIRTRAQLPPPLPGQPGPFSLGAPGVFEDALAKAGFREVLMHNVAAPLRMASAAECVQFERESFGALQQMLEGLTHAERQNVWRELARELAQYEGSQGFESPCEVIVGVGVK